jgi:membrane dipeptidase
MIRERLCFDIHGHGEGLIPSGSPLRSPDTPVDTAIGSLKGCGLDACVISAVGDMATFGLGSRNDYDAVQRQLGSLVTRIRACGGVVASSRTSLADTTAGEAPALHVLLGVEGLDFLDGSVAALGTLHDAGVRLVGLVHYTPGALGGLCMDFRGNPDGPGTAGGLTRLGTDVIKEANRLGMVVDMTHANDATILGAVEASHTPVCCSHTGPKALCGTPRYLPDDVLRAVAASGGLIGLWPERHGNAGPVDLGEFTKMIEHTVELCGVDSVAIGTDFNGVPGYADGYRGPVDLVKVADSMAGSGFPPESVAAIMGGNALRYIGAILEG